jgi:hypothetical protein
MMMIDSNFFRLHISFYCTAVLELKHRSRTYVRTSHGSQSCKQLKGFTESHAMLSKIPHGAWARITTHGPTTRYTVYGVRYSVYGVRCTICGTLLVNASAMAG